MKKLLGLIFLGFIITGCASNSVISTKETNGNYVIYYDELKGMNYLHNKKLEMGTVQLSLCNIRNSDYYRDNLEIYKAYGDNFESFYCCIHLDSRNWWFIEKAYIYDSNGHRLELSATIKERKVINSNIIVEVIQHPLNSDELKSLKEILSSEHCFLTLEGDKGRTGKDEIKPKVKGYLLEMLEK